jgi:hypothetical protein
MEKKRTTNDNPQAGTRPDIWLTHAASDDAKRAYFNAPAKQGTGNASRQRASIRKPIPCNILIRVGSTCILARKVHDISLVGAFVDMDTAGLMEGEIVEVVIGFVYNQRQIEHQISAEVVRVDTGGVGFRFCTYANRTYTDLVNLLYAM